MSLLMNLQNLWRLTADERRMYKLAQEIDDGSSADWTTQVAFERPDRPAAVECFYVPTGVFYTVSSLDEWEHVRQAIEL